MKVLNTNINDSILDDFKEKYPKGFFYIKVSKTGTQSIWQPINLRFGLNFKFLKANTEEFYNVILPRFGYTPAFSKDRFVFHTFRNPYERAMSSYLDVTNKSRKKDRPYELSFDEMLDLPFNNLEYFEGKKSLYWHCCPQCEWVPEDLVIDLLIETPNLNNFYPLLTKIFELYGVNDIQFAIRNESKGSKFNLSESQKKKIRKVYAADFDLFGKYADW